MLGPAEVPTTISTGESWGSGSGTKEGVGAECKESVGESGGSGREDIEGVGAELKESSGDEVEPALSCTERHIAGKSSWQRGSQSSSMASPTSAWCALRVRASQWHNSLGPQNLQMRRRSSGGQGSKLASALVALMVVNVRGGKEKLNAGSDCSGGAARLVERCSI